MLKKTITFEDYDGNKRTEDFHFNLSKAELMEMELSEAGGLENRVKRIIDSQDTPQIISIFKDLILKSYGVKSPDGKRFIKSKEIVDEFVQTEAYSVLFMELATDSEAASKFINSILPSDLQAELAKTDRPELAVLKNK